MGYTILAIETSCDETSAAVWQHNRLLSNVVANQTVHTAYGGVVPELASRAHQQNIVPVVDQAIKQANITKNDVNAVAFTQGPGLLGALLVGSSFAKAFAQMRNIPLIEVNHMQAHILAHFIEPPYPVFPFLCLTVSGGHTQLVVVRDFLQMEIIGQTLDDAVGEAFDKAAKMLGLPYPGGPLVDQYAATGNPQAFQFPETEVPVLNYSFSGIKTAILNFLHKQTLQHPDFVAQRLPDICASIQAALVEMLLKKLRKAAKETGIRQIAIAGGVSANSGLRQSLQNEALKQGWEVFIPAFSYCTDNAAMIAITGYHKLKAGQLADLSSSPMPRLAL